MPVKILFGLLLAINFVTGNTARASVQADPDSDATWLDEFDPNDPRAEKLLEEFDKIHERITGLPSRLPQPSLPMFFGEFGAASRDCYQDSCQVFARVSKRNQKLYLSVGGRVDQVWPVSTGVRGHSTPDFDRHPDGRIYDRYTSSTYPGGDWNGLGNMPYAVFIRRGYAIHGTPRANWAKLGQPASHGCIRLHPDNAKVFNRLVRANGIGQTWITVEE